MKIPKIIHQIWGGEKKLPKHFKVLSETWKNDYPDWQYEFWDDERIYQFVLDSYPEYYDQFISLPFNIQRWDAIRYLILAEIGGMYVDFDYESIKSLVPLIENEECCIALDPETHCPFSEKVLMLNGALMLSTPNHWFMHKIIKTVFSKKKLSKDKRPKSIQVYNYAGPRMLINLYYRLSEKEKKDIFLLSDRLVSPFDYMQAKRVISGEENWELEKLLDDAYAVHYFFGDWRAGDS